MNPIWTDISKMQPSDIGSILQGAFAGPQVILTLVGLQLTRMAIQVTRRQHAAAESPFLMIDLEVPHDFAVIVTPDRFDVRGDGEAAIVVKNIGKGPALGVGIDVTIDGSPVGAGRFAEETSRPLGRAGDGLLEGIAMPSSVDIIWRPDEPTMGTVWQTWPTATKLSFHAKVMEPQQSRRYPLSEEFLRALAYANLARSGGYGADIRVDHSTLSKEGGAPVRSTASFYVDALRPIQRPDGVRTPLAVGEMTQVATPAGSKASGLMRLIPRLIEAKLAPVVDDGPGASDEQPAALGAPRRRDQEQPLRARERYGTRTRRQIRRSERSIGKGRAKR